MKYNIPNIGTKFGEWIVVDNNIQSKKSVQYGKYVAVQCVCGFIKEVRLSTLCRGESTQCQKCIAKKRSKNYFKGVGDLSQSFFYHIQKSAISRNIEFDITAEYLWELFLNQKRVCALSGLDLCFYTSYKEKTRQTASVDRIDSSKGYIKGNVQWVHKWVNLMKLDFSQEEFIEMCELISKHRKADPRIRVLARTSVEGIHRWVKCPIEEVSYLRNYHRHIFYIEAKVYVNHTDRDVEFIKLSHDIRTYLTKKYYDEQYKCLFFNDQSCEMIADELVKEFDLYECQVLEDQEGGSIVRNL